jgi:PAS domain S-box-containing protein
VSAYPVNPLPVQIQGVITLPWGRNTIYLVDSNNISHRIQVDDNSEFCRGDRVEASGILKADDRSDFLEAATLHKIGPGILPQPVRLGAATSLERAHEGKWIQLRGRLLELLRTSNTWVYVLERKSRTYYARLETNRLTSPPPRQPSRSLVTVTGIYAVDTGPNGDPLAHQILMSSPQDIQFSGSSAWWNSLGFRRILMGVAVLAFAAMLWGIMLRRQVARQTAIVKRQLEKEAALEARYRQMVENAWDAIFALDSQGCFVSVNRAGERITGYTREELLGMKLAQLLSAEHHPAADSLLSPANLQRTGTTVELQLVAKSGSQVSLEVSMQPAFQEGRLVGLEGVGRDITRRKQAEEALRRAQKMEAIGQLAAGVAHDFNNLLTVIMGNLDLLHMNTSECPPDHGYLAQIREASERASGLTRQLLLFSRPQQVQVHSIDFNELVQNLVKMLRRLIGAHIQMECQLAKIVPRIVADPGMMEQVVLNLAVNARDAMPNGGCLILKTTEVRFDSSKTKANPDRRPGWFLCFEVADTGLGMDEHTRRRIFEPFFTTKEPGKGTGLGLATVEGIVKKHEGWIEVDSHPGQGTVFRVYLPAQEAPAETAVAKPVVSADPGGSENILVVEDEPGVREMLVCMLGRKGYHVLTARTGPEALRTWAESPCRIQMLLTDLVLPGGMGGIELARELRVKYPELKVIFSSGYGPEASSDPSLPSDHVWFLQKPYSSQRLLRIVRECLDATEASDGT